MRRGDGDPLPVTCLLPHGGHERGRQGVPCLLPHRGHERGRQGLWCRPPHRASKLKLKSRTPIFVRFSLSASGMGPQPARLSIPFQLRLPPWPILSRPTPDTCFAPSAALGLPAYLPQLTCFRSVSTVRTQGPCYRLHPPPPTHP